MIQTFQQDMGGWKTGMNWHKIEVYIHRHDTQTLKLMRKSWPV